MPKDPLSKHRDKASAFGITGEERFITPANKLPQADYDPSRPSANCRYDWQDFAPGDWMSIPSKYREIWYSARSSAYSYAARSGKRFRTAMGSHELLIWRHDSNEDLDMTPDKVRLRRATAYLDIRNDVRSSETHEVLQTSRNDQEAHILRAMYVLSGQHTPQDYRVILE